MATNGTDIVLYVNTGTPSTPVWTKAAGQRNVSFTDSTAPIDTSSKDSADQTVIAGRDSAGITLDQLYVKIDPGFAALKAAKASRALIKLRRNENAIDIEQADALITELPVDAPDQDVATTSISLVVSGGWAAV